MPSIPEQIADYGPVEPFLPGCAPARPKLLTSLREAIVASGLKDGGTVSFHHHLRNGDQVINMVLAEIAALGLKDITVAASSLFAVHAPLVEHLRSGVVVGIHTAYMSGPVAHAVSRGLLKRPAVMTTHGGRARSIECGRLRIDCAFIAAPTADACGNMNGVDGESACGTLGYAVADACHAKCVVAVTDNLVPYPVCPVEISQDRVDFVVAVDSIGDPAGIVSGTTRATADPVGLRIAASATEVIAASGLLVDGFSFQTGAGGISLAVAAGLKDAMRARGVQGSFASGGITGYIVDMLEAGLFRTLFDVQCFDLKAVESYRRNPSHLSMSASMYANPHRRGSVVDQLDVMILGATEIDLEFNVNVTTGSDGVIMGGSGGHADAAAGARVALVTTRLNAGGFAKLTERVTTITTPGSTVDVLVTDEGIAVNPRRTDLIELLQASGIGLRTIGELKAIADERAVRPAPVRSDAGRIVAVVEYRDGTVIDVVRMVQ
jgi:citrate lyase subunit alpha/citrate CoA-transferase